MKNVESVYKKIKSAFWDYNNDLEKFYLNLFDKIPAESIFTKDKIS